MQALRVIGKIAIFIIGLMIGWTLAGCGGTNAYSSRPSSVTTVQRVYESSYGYHLYRISGPEGSSYATPVYRSPIDGPAVWRVDR